MFVVGLREVHIMQRSLSKLNITVTAVYGAVLMEVQRHANMCDTGCIVVNVMCNAVCLESVETHRHR